MSTPPKTDERSPERRAKDEQIVAEPQMSPLELPPEATATPIETRMEQQRRHPVAIEGVVENGLVRPVDPAVKLTEHSRVIIVAPE